MKCTWGDICTLEYGKALRDYTEGRTEENRFRVFGTNGPIGWSSRALAPGPGVIVGRKGAYRGINFSPEPFFVIDTAYYLRPKDDQLDLKWAYYKLLTVDINRIDVGAAIPTTSRDAFYAVSVDVPPRAKQEALVATLSAYDDQIENNRRRMALLEEAARLLYREWFVRLRFPGHEHTRIMDGVPEGWERTSFETALTLQRGFDLPIQLRQAGDIPIYGSTGISGYHDKFKVKGPGIITGRSGTLGEVHFVRDDFWPLNTALWVKEFRRVTPLFALFLLRSMDLKQYNGGVSVPTLDRKTVHRVEVLIPTQRLLTGFNELASTFFDQVANLALQNEKLKIARDLLLPRLMSGDLVP